ncbi:MAG TPA: 23S rRNA (adenine(2030)-N(6))-methyltransferase RlmJ [Steroidobacteraceae bacterium]|nr:23S rRNA (adenine(2030)-N(6))-methyltransferase RlmJ [Steroidobacteraceae bacterium]
MKYRHRYHAGNFADVHKHVAVLALLQALQRKERGLLYLETHAGAGAYDLDDPASHRGAEARQGVLAVLAAQTLGAPELTAYREAVLNWRRERAGAQAYPGSPLLAAGALRAQDRALLCELLPPECRALERAAGGAPRLQIQCTDGYQALAASLPPRERRALILIDPPYEQPLAEVDQALAAIELILARLANAVVALWYPLKDEHWLAAWQARAKLRLTAPATALELWLYPRDAGVALNGSGLLLINPPYQFDMAARLWQRELRTLLEHARPAAAPPGGDAVRIVVDEREAGHAGA